MHTHALTYYIFALSVLVIHIPFVILLHPHSSMPIPLPFINATTPAHQFHCTIIYNSFIQFSHSHPLSRVSEEYLDTGTKRKDTTGKDTMSMLKDAILLSVVMLLLCAINHAHSLVSVEEQGAGMTRGSFSQRRKILGLK